jgi:hypothetical protein
MNISPSRTEISESFCLCPSNNIKQLFVKAVNSGISISDLNIPAILLADDTTLLSTSAHGLQRLLDCVQNYACRWRLTYNGTKSCLMLFDGHKQNDSEISVRLGEIF